jgi:hypothetical protein
MSDETFYAVVRDSDSWYYAGDGRFTSTVLEAARFFTIEDAQKAAASLNQQGFCDGSCRGKTVWVDYPLQNDQSTGIEFKTVSIPATEPKLQQIKSSVTELGKELEKNFVISSDGTIKEIPALGCGLTQCTVSYIDCSTKQPATLCLNEGETAIYRTWNGTICETQEYTCQIALAVSSLAIESSSNTTENVDLCSGDGNGPLIVSPRDTRAQVKVCGRKGDLIRYWYDGARLINDEIRDGDGLNSNDVKFPQASNPDILPRPPFAVRHGRQRDLVRVYAPPKGRQPATVNRYERRRENNINVAWLDANRLQVMDQVFIYDARENAFIRQGVPRNMQDIRAIGG